MPRFTGSARSDVDWPSIVGRDGPIVWRTVYRLLGNHADAEDCYQETFLSALDLWDRQPVRNSRAVLQRLATTRAMDRLRKRYRAATRIPALNVDCDQEATASPGPPESAESAELAARLRDALATLPPRQAEVFCLFSLDGWSYHEIGGHLNMTLDAVGVLLHRARAKLRLKLAALAPEQAVKVR
jgi:RNA polymerase sigma-70 factor (ECF subfamily)